MGPTRFLGSPWLLPRCLTGVREGGKDRRPRFLLSERELGLGGNAIDDPRATQECLASPSGRAPSPSPKGTPHTRQSGGGLTRILFVRVFVLSAVSNPFPVLGEKAAKNCS